MVHDGNIHLTDGWRHRSFYIIPLRSAKVCDAGIVATRVISKVTVVDTQSITQLIFTRDINRFVSWEIFKRCDAFTCPDGAIGFYVLNAEVLKFLRLMKKYDLIFYTRFESLHFQVAFLSLIINEIPVVLHR